MNTNHVLDTQKTCPTCDGGGLVTTGPDTGEACPTCDRERWVWS